MNIFVFDIETIPDVESAKKIYNLSNLSDRATADAVFHLRKEKVGHEFLPHYLHKVAAISVVFSIHDKLKVWSLGDPDSDEKEIIERFFKGIERYSPVLVSWNGSGFDLPVLHYRCLHHGINAARYWDVGNDDQSFKWNNYINRYHYRHLDLMDVLACYQSRANAPLDDIATMLGFPGKMGMSGAKVWDSYLNGDIQSIRDYCETDVLNTYLVYLRFELMRGNINESKYTSQCNRLKDYLEQEQKAHFSQFLQSWSQD